MRTYNGLGNLFNDIYLLSISGFWLLGSFYGIFRKPKIYFPVSLAAKMTFAALVGCLLFIVGGLVFSTLVFNNEMHKRQDYEFWPVIITGAALSILGSTLMVFLFIYLISDPLQRGV